MVAIHWGWIVFGVIFLIFMAMAIIITIFLLWRLRWNYTWVLLQEQANGKCEIVRKGRMRAMAFGDGGEEIFFLRGIKKFKVAYGKKIGKNQIAWCIGSDGYWYNTDFAGLDRKLREIGVFPVDRDMRYGNSVIRKGIEQRHGQQTFMEKYGTIITFGMLFLCILALGVSQWWSFHELNKGSGTAEKNLQTQERIVDKYDALLERITNAQANTGSGARTVAPA